MARKNNYIDTDKKNLNYVYIAKDMRKKLKQCRQKIGVWICSV